MALATTIKIDPRSNTGISRRGTRGPSLLLSPPIPEVMGRALAQARDKLAPKNV